MESNYCVFTKCLSLYVKAGVLSILLVSWCKNFEKETIANEKSMQNNVLGNISKYCISSAYNTQWMDIVIGGG